jgi:energy-coupling factor transport system permease protein
MSEFELLRNVTIGQYIPTGSIIHRLDPRAKIVGAMFLVFAISFSGSLIEVGLELAIVLAIVYLARLPFGYVFRGLILGLPVLVFVFGFSMLFRGFEEPAGRVYLEWRFLRFTRYSIWLTSLGLTRIIALLFLTSIITMTSTTTELTHGLEKLLEPIRVGRWRMPAHQLALINMIALRFVPTFAEEMERVMKAQASRGGDFTRKIYRPDKAARAYLPLMVPLFISAFRRAEELVYAMEARCYISGDERTKFVTLKSGPKDWAVAIASFIFFVAVLFIRWPSILIVARGMGVDIF